MCVGGGIIHWYLNRYRKLLVPYLLTLAPIVICQVMEWDSPAHGFVDYVLYITSFRFYISHDAPWFIAAIIPLYLLTPLFFSLIKKYAWLASDLIIVVMWSILLIKPTSDTEVINDILRNIQFVSVRATSFVLGISLGRYVQGRRRMRASFLALLVILGVVACSLTKHLVYGYFFFSLPVLFFMIHILDNCDQGLKTFTGFMGKISLESYILNGALPSMMIILFSFIGMPTLHNLLPYIAACAIGTVIGWYIHKISDKILRINIILDENTH